MLRYTLKSIFLICLFVLVSSALAPATDLRDAHRSELCDSIGHWQRFMADHYPDHERSIDKLDALCAIDGGRRWNGA